MHSPELQQKFLSENLPAGSQFISIASQVFGRLSRLSKANGTCIDGVAATCAILFVSLLFETMSEPAKKALVEKPVFSEALATFLDVSHRCGLSVGTHVVAK